MYVVILAGGGGTRLWPLSRPERPKPFLPLLGDETLLQRTVSRHRPARLRDGDVFCVTDRRYGQLVRDQVPDVRADRRADRPQHGRGDRPRHGRRSTGPRTRSCSSCRPTTGSSDEDVFRDVVSRRPSSAWRRRVRHRGAARHARHPARPPVDRLRLPPARHDARRRRSTASRPIRCSAFEEKPTEAPGARADQPAGRRLERRDVRLAARRDPGRAREVHAAADADRARRTGRELALGARLRPDQADLDRPGGDGGRRRRPPRRHGRDGRRLERPRQLDGAARGARPAATVAARSGRVVQRARRSRSGPTTSCVRPVDGRLAVDGSDGRVRSWPTASGRISPGPATSRPTCERCSTGSPARRSARDEHRRGAGPDDDRLRHRRLAGQDRRRLHVRERPALRRRRRPLRRRARRAGEGRRHRLRPAVRLRALRRRGRRGPPRPRHPGRLRRPTPCRPR